MTRNEDKQGESEKLMIIIANQNYYVRNVISKMIDFLETLFIAVAILVGVVVVDCLVVAATLSVSDDPVIPLILLTLISIPIICIAVITPIRRFMIHARAIEKLHQRYTDTETMVLEKCLKKE